MYLAPQKLGAINCPIKVQLSYGEIATSMGDSKINKNESHRFSGPFSTSPALDNLFLSCQYFYPNGPSFFPFFAYV